MNLHYPYKQKLIPITESEVMKLHYLRGKVNFLIDSAREGTMPYDDCLDGIQTAILDLINQGK